MTYPPHPVRRGLPWWAWILIALAAVAMLFVGLVAVGVIGFGVAANTGDSDQKRSRDFSAADPAGGSACAYLDTYLYGGIGTWENADSVAEKATTSAVRAATTPRQMYDACVAAGANMSPWREPTNR